MLEIAISWLILKCYEGDVELKESSPLITRKAVISIILLIVAAYLFIQGVTYTNPAWPQSKDITIALYLVGAAMVFAIALIPWTKE